LKKKLRVKSSFLILLFFFPFFLVSPGNLNPYENPEKLRAAQVFFIESTNYEDLEKEIIRMKSYGINTFILRVFSNKGDRIHGVANPKSPIGVYYFTTHAPVVDNILGKVVQICQRHGLRVFAWMTTRDAIYGATEDMFDVEFSIQYRKGIKVNKLDLFNEKSVKYLEKLYTDLAAYPIDGVLFQDDFILRHTESYSPSAKSMYFKDFGRELNPGSMYKEASIYPNGKVKRIVYKDEFWKWAEWKNKRVKEVAKRLIHALRAKNPEIKTAVNLYYEALTKPKNSLAWTSQDMDLALMFNYVAVMSYHRQIIDELGVGKKESLELIKDMSQKALTYTGSPERIIMKIQTLDWKDQKQIPLEEINRVYKTIVSASPNISIAFTPWTGKIR